MKTVHAVVLERFDILKKNSTSIGFGISSNAR